MSNRQPDLYSERAAYPPFPTPPLNEPQFLRDWENDIKRAAYAAAKGDGDKADDLAQQARARVLLARRALPDAPTAYVRTVIANTLRSEIRREARSLGTCGELDDDLAASSDEPMDERAATDERAEEVSAWTARLPTRLREIYRHLYADDRSQREAATLMRVSQPRVAQLHKQLLERGRAELAHLAA